MSTPDHPLTRRQLREIRNTASTPVITKKQLAAESGEDLATIEPAPPVAPLPRPAEPTVVPPAPRAESAVDLEASPLTRRQAREQEKIRTASVPVITPEVAAQHRGETTAAAEETVVEEVVEEPGAQDGVVEPEAETTTEDSAAVSEPVEADVAVSDPVEADVVVDESETIDPIAVEPADEDSEPSELVDESGDAGTDRADAADAEAHPVTVDPSLGADLLEGKVPPADVPDSFDDLLTRGSNSSGSSTAPHSLILSSPTDGSGLTVVTSTGEVIVTGMYDLPEGLASKGHAPGTADGKDLDIALIDGELPAHSSPTPISASAAISTVRGDAEIIRPPAPDGPSKSMIFLTITLGVVVAALAGVIIWTIVTGLQ